MRLRYASKWSRRRKTRFVDPFRPCDDVLATARTRPSDCASEQPTELRSQSHRFHPSRSQKMSCPKKSLNRWSSHRHLSRMPRQSRQKWQRRQGQRSAVPF